MDREGDDEPRNQPAARVPLWIGTSRAESPVAIPAGDLHAAAGGVHSGGDRLHPLRLLHLLAGPLPDQPRPRQVLLGQLQLPPRHLPHPRRVSVLQCGSSTRRRPRAVAGADRQVEVEHGTTTVSLIILFHGTGRKVKGATLLCGSVYIDSELL